MMAGTIESGKSLSLMWQHKSGGCTTVRNLWCELDSSPDPGEHFVDDEPALRYVDLSNRHELERFERWDDAELACGFFRFIAIACELSPMPLPGLPADIIL
jgi:hypothetical protein